MITKYENLTERNGQMTKRVTKKWSKLLENTKRFAPIKSEHVKASTAMLLENQLRSLNEAATNSSVFGPQNGMTGGALNSTDSYATGDFRLPRILIPMVRRIFPALMANEVVGVQPMPGPVALGFALRYKYLKGALHHGDTGTRHFHDGGANAEPNGKRGVEATIAYTTAAGAAVDATALNTAIANLAAAEEALAADKDNTTKQQAVTTAIAAVKSAAEALPGVFTVIAGQGHPVQQHMFVVEQVGPSGVDSNGAPQWRASVSQLVLSLTGVSVAPSIAYDPHTAVSGLDLSVVKSKIAALAASGAKVVGISFDDEAIKPGAANGGWGNTEMGFQRLDTRYTGRTNEQLKGEFAGGRWKFRPEDTGVAALMQQFEDTGAVAKTSFGFEKKAVEAGTRRLATSWTLETQEDLKNTNGIDIEDEATQQMSFELQAEIDREMVVRMIHAALAGNEWSVWDGQLADARWMGERARAFYQNIIKRSMRMELRNRRGPANFIVCTPDVCALLEALDEFIVMPVSTSVSTANMSSAKVGTIGRFSVYNDTRTAVYDGSDYGDGYDSMFEAVEEPDTVKLPNYCMLGYKGANSYDAGIIYCPYIPIMVQKAVDPYSFAPNIGLFTRYGVLDNIFGAHLYYHMIIIDSFNQPGTPEPIVASYPAGALTPKQDAALGTDDDRLGYKFPVNNLGN